MENKEKDGVMHTGMIVEWPQSDQPERNNNWKQRRRRRQQEETKTKITRFPSRFSPRRREQNRSVREGLL